MPEHSGQQPGDLKGVSPAHWCFSSRRRSSAFSARSEASVSLMALSSASVSAMAQLRL